MSLMKQFTHIDWCNSCSQFSEDSGPTKCDIAHLCKRGREGRGRGGKGRGGGEEGRERRGGGGRGEEEWR